MHVASLLNDSTKREKMMHRNDELWCQDKQMKGRKDGIHRPMNEDVWQGHADIRGKQG